MGMVERFHSTLIEIYRLAKYEQKFTDATSVMTYAVMAYNNTIHSVTELTPFEIVFGHTKLNSVFDNEFEKAYKQQLLKDHKKRTQTLYKYIFEKMKAIKEKVREKRGGEIAPELELDQSIFAKVVNKRQPKHKSRYQKAKVTGPLERNVAPIKANDRETKVPIKNVKRPPQVVFTTADMDDSKQSPSRSGPQKPGPSSSKT